MCRCHKINIVGFLSLKLKKYLSQPIYCDDFSRLFNSLMAYFIRRCRQFTIPMAYFTRCFRQSTSPMTYFILCPICVLFRNPVSTFHENLIVRNCNEMRLNYGRIRSIGSILFAVCSTYSMPLASR